MSGFTWRQRLSRTVRRPSLEVHVPIAPTPSFLRQLQCLTHSLRRFGGVHSGAPVIATVGGDQVDTGLAQRMPWLAANGIELRWVPHDYYESLGMFATVATRLKHRFQSDVVLLLDADTLIRRPLDGLVELVYRKQLVAGTIAHTSPLLDSKLDPPDWTRLFALFGLGEPRLAFEHTGWGYYFADPRLRYCPAYFNYGVVAGPAQMVTEIGRVSEAFLLQLRAIMGSCFDAQLALTMAIAKLSTPVFALPLRYNMPNHPYLEALHATEVEPAVILHLLADLHFRRDETFASLTGLKAFLARTDLRLVSAHAQEVIRTIFPSLSAEESLAATAA